MKTKDKNNLKEGAMSTISVLGGLSGGVLGINKLPAPYGKWILLSAGVAGTFLVENKNLQVVMAAIGAVGLAKVLKDATAGKTGILNMVNTFTPTLAGVGRLGNVNMPMRLGRLGNNPAGADAVPLDYAGNLSGSLGNTYESSMPAELSLALS